MDENAIRIEKMVKRDLAEWNKLWNKLDKHGKKFTKKDLYRLNLVNEKIDYYQEIGILVSNGDSSRLKEVFQKIKEAFGRNKQSADTLKINFKERDCLERFVLEEEGINKVAYRKIRLSYQGGSIIGALLHKVKDWQLNRELKKELKLAQCIFEHNYQNKFDHRYDNRMIETNLKTYEPLIDEHTDLWEIIKRNGKWKLNIGLFRFPIKREKIAFDQIDLADLTYDELLRDSVVYPASKDEETQQLQHLDEKYKDELKERGKFLGTIERDDEEYALNNDKVIDLKTYSELALKNRVQEKVSSNQENGINHDERTEESQKAANGIAR